MYLSAFAIQILCSDWFSEYLIKIVYVSVFVSCINYIMAAKKPLQSCK